MTEKDKEMTEREELEMLRKLNRLQELEERDNATKDVRNVPERITESVVTAAEEFPKTDLAQRVKSLPKSLATMVLNTPRSASDVFWGGLTSLRDLGQGAVENVLELNKAKGMDFGPSEYQEKATGVKEGLLSAYEAAKEDPFGTAKKAALYPYTYYDDKYGNMSIEERTKYLEENPAEFFLDALAPTSVARGIFGIKGATNRLISDEKTLRQMDKATDLPDSYDKIDFNKRKRINTTILNEGLNPNRRDAGKELINRKKQILERNINAAIDELGSENPISLNEVIAGKNVTGLVNESIEGFKYDKNLLDEAYEEVTHKLYSDNPVYFDSGNITVREANDFKRDIYRKIEQIYSKADPGTGVSSKQAAKIVILKNIAKNTKEAIEKRFPAESGFDIKAANERYSNLIEVDENWYRLAGNKIKKADALSDALQGSAWGGATGAGALPAAMSLTSLPLEMMPAAVGTGFLMGGIGEAARRYRRSEDVLADTATARANKKRRSTSFGTLGGAGMLDIALPVTNLGLLSLQGEE